MINREQLVKLSDDLVDNWKEENSKKKYPNEISMLRFSLQGRAEEAIGQLSNEVGRLQRELEIAKAEAKVWKEVYLEQIKENTLMQARMLKDA
jgi:hypothetical protein